MKKLLMAMGALVVLQGCSTVGGWAGNVWEYRPWYERDDRVSEALGKKIDDGLITDDYFKARLLETAELVNQSLRELAEIEQAIRIKRHLEIAQASDQVKDARLLQMVTISSLSGTQLNIESMVERLATVAEYEFKVFGKKPLVPITVSVPKGQYRLIDLLKNVGMQAGGIATVYVKEGVIELVYRDDV